PVARGRARCAHALALSARIVKRRGVAHRGTLHASVHATYHGGHSPLAAAVASSVRRVAARGAGKAVSARFASTVSVAPSASDQRAVRVAGPSNVPPAA